MTLNAVIALILRLFHRIRQIFRPIVSVVEDRPIMSVKYCLPVPSTFGQNYNALYSVVSLR